MTLSTVFNKNLQVPLCTEMSFFTNDIDLKANFQWKHENIRCISCKTDSPETNEHLLECSSLMGKNKIVTYIPEYKELFSQEQDEVLYLSRVLKENFKNKRQYLKQ